MKLAYRIILGMLLVVLVVGILPAYKGLASPDTEILRPNAAGDVASWQAVGAATNYECVDEVVADGDATYVEGIGQVPGESWLQDLYNITNSSGSGDINSVTVYARFRGTGAGNADVAKIIMETGSTVYESSVKTITTSYADYTEQWATNPDTGQRWTWGEIDVLQIGVSHLTHDLPPTRLLPRCTQVYVEVDYTFALSDISNALYYGTILVSNNSTATTNVAVNCTISTQVLIDGGYLNASTNNSVIRSSAGADLAFMPSVNASYPWCFFVPSIGENAHLTDILYTAESTGGKIRYFPSDVGMGNPDNQPMELAANFTIEQKGFWDTSYSANKTTVHKEDAYGTYISGTENITSWMDIGVVDNNVNTDGGLVDIWGAIWIGQIFTATRTYSVTGFQVIGKETGNAPGVAGINLRASAGGLPVGDNLTIGTFDPTTWGAASAWQPIAYFDTPYQIVNGNVYAIIINLPDGVGAANDLKWDRDSGNPYAGGTRVSSADSGNTWGTSGAQDLAFRIIGTLANVTASSVSSGEHTVRTSANVSHLWIDVDGATQNTMALGGVTVPDNANGWDFLINNAMPYMEYHYVTVNGTQVQYIDWEYNDTTFSDNSTFNNDATPTFRTVSSDADVSAEFTSFQPIAEAQAPAYALTEAPAFIDAGALTGNITGVFTTLPPAGTFPLAGVITAVANATSTPPQLPLLIIAVFVILACSLTVSATMRKYGSGSLIPKIIAITAVMGVFVGLGNFGIDDWMLYVFLVIAIALAMASRQTTWA